MKKVLFIFCLLISFASIGQSNKELQRLKVQSSKTKAEIERTSKLIKETEKTRKVTLEKLSLIEQQINLRQEYVLAIRAEMRALQQSVALSEAQIRTLEAELKQMQEEYNLTLFTLYKMNGSYDQLIFILSAENFNQSFNRLKYLQYYSDFMIKQATQIEGFKDSLGVKIENQKKLIGYKNSLLQTEEKAKLELSKDKNSQSNTLQDLKEKQQELTATLQKKKALAKKLNQQIESIIRQIAASSKKTPKDNIISKNFAENKGRLPWPTNNGRITQKFGTHRHPTLPIDVDCNGIDITTSKGTKARAVFEGIVTKIVVIPGRNTAVLIKHGEYFTVYDNLINVSVKPGQTVRVKQEIGTIYTDSETGLTVLQLQIWKKLQKLNPEPWLSKK